MKSKKFLVLLGTLTMAFGIVLSGCTSRQPSHRV
jgi:hypothetical protein